jgi:hypothetical protein
MVHTELCDETTMIGKNVTTTNFTSQRTGSTSYNYQYWSGEASLQNPMSSNSTSYLIEDCIKNDENLSNLPKERTFHSIQECLLSFTTICALYYNFALCVYYLCVIKYSMRDRDFSRKIEPWLHISPLLYNFLMFTSIYDMTRIKRLDDDINASSSQEAHDGLDDNKEMLLHIFFEKIVPFTLVLTAVLIVMGMLNWKIWLQERRMNQYRLSLWTTTTYSAESDIRARRNRMRSQKKVKAAQTRALLYFLLIFLGYGLPWFQDVVNCCLGWTSQALFIVSTSFVRPLQGFFNTVVYLAPQITSIRTRSNSNFSHPRASFIALKTFDVILDNLTSLNRSGRRRRSTRLMSTISPRRSSNGIQRNGSGGSTFGSSHVTSVGASGSTSRHTTTARSFTSSIERTSHSVTTNLATPRRNSRPIILYNVSTITIVEEDDNCF